MITMTLPALASLLELDETFDNLSFQGISIDTRTLTPQNLFVAVQGEQFDGHDYLSRAHEKGAVAALVNRKIDSPLPQLIVPDTLIALGKITENWRHRFSLPLIGVTGSNGKTTLKNMITRILQAATQTDAVLSTEGNLNNNIGLPLTLARLNAHHQYGVIEMGMNHFGEIAYLTELTQPDVAVINNAAAAHLAGLKNIAGVAKAKGEIFLGLSKKGTAILNQDDDFFDYWKNLIGDRRFITFGLKNKADVSATVSSDFNPNAQRISIHTPQGNIDVNLPLLGLHNVMNALAATATALALDINLTAIKAGLESIQPAPGRLNQYVLPNQVRIIDDSYNANPVSLNAGIQTLASFKGKKIIVLGDMRELGSDEKSLHATAGENARAAGIDYLFTLGELSEHATKSFGPHAAHFTDREKLVLALQPHLHSECTILVKGSHSMHMEKIVAKLMPENTLTH
jgi:UDP-N-acetylmuramoyl-tripeptide--D-alanyl-D-alanine ligase